MTDFLVTSHKFFKKKEKKKERSLAQVLFFLQERENFIGLLLGDTDIILGKQFLYTARGNLRSPN